MLKTNLKIKLVFPVVMVCVLLALAGEVEAAIFVDNAASGCSNGSTSYNPSNRTCSGGRDTVYTSLNNAAASGGGTSGSPKVFNVRYGRSYYETFTSPSYTTWQKYSSDANKPLVDGQWDRPSMYGALMTISNTTRVTVDGLAFARAGYKVSGTQKYSEAIGIHGDYATYVTIQNCQFTDIGDSSIHLRYNGVGHLIQDNLISHSGHAGYSGEANLWMPSINLRRGTTNSSIRRNIIDGVWNEGISTDEDCRDNIIEYNTIRNNARVALYFPSATRETIRYNLVYNTNDDEFINGTFSGLGIMISSETASYTNGNGFRIYGNMIAGMAVGILVDGDYRAPGWQLNDTKIYNNTLIEMQRADDQWGTQDAGWEVRTVNGNPIGSGVEFKNNFIWQTNGYTGNDPGTGVIYSNNLWNKAPTTACKSPTDPIYSAYPTPNITDYFQKQSNWTNLSGTTLTVNNFKLRSTALNAIDKGTDLGSPYNSDYFGNIQSGIWDIGALVYGGTIGAVCGNSVVETGEQCDNGSNNGTCPKVCSSSCSNNICETGNEISKTNWTLQYVDSQELINEYAPATYAFDNNPSTFWHTSWDNSSQPHEIQINLNANYNLTGLRYLPRQDGGTNGIIKNYEVDTSSDGTNWTLKSNGSFSSDTTQKEISFAQSNVGYVRLRSTSEINGNGWTSAAEITLLGSAVSGDTTAPSAPGGLSVR